MASPSEHKDGLRCGRREQKHPPWGTVTECPGLILEYDSIQGLGARCSKKNCRAFHPLEVLLSQAVEQDFFASEQLVRIRAAVTEEPKSTEKQEKEMTTAKMKAYALYLIPNRRRERVLGDRVRQDVVVVARSPKEAASILGGDYREPEGGMQTVSTPRPRDEFLHFVGTVSFAPELFRKMDETDRALAGLYGGSGTYSKGPLHLLTYGEVVELLMYEDDVILPDYAIFQGYNT